MPYINVKTNAKLDDEQKTNILKQLSKSITLIKGKSEKYVMCAVEDKIAMSFRGDTDITVAMVEVKVLGSCEKSDCEKLTAKICDILKSYANINGDCCYVKFEEVEKWGFDSNMF